MRRILVWLAPVVVLLFAAAPARAVAPGWAQGASLTTGRDWHSATLLGDALLVAPVVVAGLALLSWEDLSFSALARGRVETREGEANAALEASTLPPSGTESR